MKSYLRYFYAILAVPVIILTRFALIPLTGPVTPFITLFPATVIIALLGGMGPAILTGILGVLATDYFFIQPLHSLDISLDFWSRTAVVVLTSTFVGYVGAVLRAAREKAEKQAIKLRASQMDLNRAQTVAHTGSWRLDVRQNKLSWSDESYRIFSVPKGTPLTYESFLTLVHPDDRDFVDKKWKSAQAGEDYDIEHRIIVDGKVKWVREKAELEFDKDGASLGGFGTVTDITARKQMEEELRKSHDELEIRVKERTAELDETVAELQKQVVHRIQAEESIKAERQRFNDVLETLPVYICLLTPDYYMPFANRVFRELFGYYPDKKCYEFLFDRIEPCEICETYSVLKTMKPHEWEWTGPNGRNYYIFDFPFTDTDGSTLILEMGIDITERKRAERRQTVTNSLLELFVKKTSRKEYLDSVVKTIRDWSGCRCVGIRLTNSEGFIPYESCIGFSEEFLALESMLSLKTDACACARVILQAPEPQDAPVMTSKGSFRCDNTFGFIDTLTRREKERYRGNCIKSGFASVAVIPIRYRQKVLGAIHIADENQNKVPFETVEFLENMAMLIGEAIHRFNTETALRVSESRLAEAQRIASLGNWDWDIVKNELWWSDEVYRIFGTNPREFQTTYEAFLSYVHPDDRDFVKQSVNEALNKQKPYSIDHRVICPDGTERIVHEQAEVTYEANQKPVRMMGTVQDVTKQKKAEEEIRHNQDELRSLAAQLQLTEERERRQIASDLHDSVGQILAFARREIGSLQRAAPEKLAISLREIAYQLDKAVKQTRALSFDLSPSVLYDLGFEAAIEDLADKFAQERKIQCHFKNSEEPKPLADYVKILLYRSIRELLINVAKHAEAKTVIISLTKVDDNVAVSVQDDGKGFDTSNLQRQMDKYGGFGIFSIQERLAHIGGRFEIQSSKGKGTKVTLQVPLNKRYAKKRIK